MLMTLHAVVALLPALLFLAILVLMDSFKLARPGSIALAVVGGVAAALVCAGAYQPLQRLAPNPASFSRYVAPVVEETAKGAFVVFFLATGRIGFLVDAGQLGFAVGTGFALVENVHYLRALPDAGLVLWLVRGLGTAVLHGATTAVFAMVSKTGCTSVGDPLMTRRIWLVAVCCSSLSFVSLKRRALSMAMAACRAKVSTSATWLGENSPGSRRHRKIAP